MGLILRYPFGLHETGPRVPCCHLQVPLFPWAWWDMASLKLYSRFQETSTFPLVLTWLSPLLSPSLPTSADVSQTNSRFAYGKTEHPRSLPEATLRTFQTLP